MSKAAGNLLVELRQGTEVAHRRLEKHPLLRPLLAPTLSLEHYSRVIAAFTGFYETLEPRIMELALRIAVPGYRYEPRLPYLLEDRAVLLPCAVTPGYAAPEFGRDDELVGALYVLEGATQGGRVIAPWVQQKLALTESAGARYFNLYRQNSWEGFRNMVAQGLHDYDSSVAAAAARATFDHLYSHLDLCLSSSGDHVNE